MAANTFPLRRTRTRRLRALAVVGSALIAMTMVAGTATATIVERDRSIRPRTTSRPGTAAIRCRSRAWRLDLIHVRADNRTRGQLLLHRQLPGHGDVDRGRRPVLHAVAQRPLQECQAHQIDGSLYQFDDHETGQPFVIADSRARSSTATVGTSSAPTPTTSSRASQLRAPDPRPAPDVLPGSLRGGGTARRTVRLGEAPDGSGRSARPAPRTATTNTCRRATPRTDRRVRCSCSSTDLARTATGPRRLSTNCSSAGIPKYINVDGWDTARPFVVLAISTSRTAWLRLLAVRGRQPVGRVLRHAAPARPRQRATCPLHIAG